MSRDDVTDSVEDFLRQVDDRGSLERDYCETEDEISYLLADVHDHFVSGTLPPNYADLKADYDELKGRRDSLGQQLHTIYEASATPDEKRVC